MGGSVTRVAHRGSVTCSWRISLDTSGPPRDLSFRTPVPGSRRGYRTIVRPGYRPSFPSVSSRCLERGDGVAIRWRQLRTIRLRCPVDDPLGTGITRSRWCHLVCRPAASLDWTSLPRIEPLSGIPHVPRRHHRSTSFDRELRARDLATPRSVTCWARTLSDPSGEGETGRDPEMPATVPTNREPSLPVPDLARDP
jgi:hypothetical protein